MASILDIGLLNIFSGFFTFMLVYAVVWGLLTWRKWPGDNKSVHAIIAFVSAMFVTFIPPIRQFVSFVTPMYVTFAIVLFFILFIVTIFGKTDKDFVKIIEDSRVYIWIIIISIIILLAGLAYTFGQSALEEGTGIQQPITQGVPDGTAVIGGNGAGYQPPGTVVYNGGNYYQTGGPQPGMPGSTATPDFKTNLINTLLHPTVLGILMIMMIAALGIYFLSAG